MPKHIRRWAVLLALGYFALAGRASAAEINPAEVKSVAVHPAKVALTGADDAAQLVVTATLANGQSADLTHDVQYSVADAKLAAVLSGGRVVPKGNGTSEIFVTFGGQT